MAKRDFSNRICVEKGLVSALKAEGERLLFEDLTGIVNHILRNYLSGEQSKPMQSDTTVQTTTASTAENFDIDDFDLAA